MMRINCEPLRDDKQERRNKKMRDEKRKKQKRSYIEADKAKWR
ncbi:MAG: hypothetical protein AAGJ17_06765 [Pseudomonadota bacterium]|jgi:hypothetical protein|tara:strand:- start:378 stop:506 length:129 start_codon:yes stop_codon:yes gene_type:complete